VFHNIKDCFSENDAKKIFGNKENAIKYLSIVFGDIKNLKKLSTKEI
jgi:hypothetical protein